MLDKTAGFTFESLRNRLPLFGGDLVRAIQALQREDYLALRACIEDMPLRTPFSRKDVLVEVLSKNLVVAYRYYFKELKNEDSIFIFSASNVIFLRKKMIELSGRGYGVCGI